MHDTRGSRSTDGHLREVLDAAHEAYLRVDANGVVIDDNRAARELFASSTALVGCSFHSLRPPSALVEECAHLRDVRHLPERPVLRTAVIRPSDRHARAVEANVWADDRDGRRTVHLLLRDVSETRSLQPEGPATGMVHAGTERSQAAGATQARASTDPPTGLVDRDHLDAALADLLRSAAPGRGVGLLLVEIDDFRQVTDTLGHAVGDQLLREIAGRLTSLTGDHDVVARRHGDEFVVVTPGIGGPADAIAVAAELRTALAEPFALDTITVGVGASIGIVSSPAHGTDPRVLLDKAGVASRRAKTLPAGWAVFEESPDRQAVGRMQLAADLRDAIAAGRIDVAYQPIVAARTRDVAAFEALARWDHPTRGPVPPDQFVPLAEQAELCLPLTTTVLRRAVSDCAAWLDAGHDLRVAVNVSAVALEDPALVTVVDDALAAAGLAPERLILEITESAVAADVEQFNGALERLHELGVSLAVDDFGTGYSAMSHLKGLPGISELKIDRSFVRDIASDTRDLAIVRSLIRLAQSLSLRVVAEGVETAMVLELLDGLGCDYAQGFGIARPMPAGQVLDWLGSHVAAGRARVPVEPSDLLVVDDSATVRAHLTGLAEQSGWRVRTAESAEDAVDAIDRSRPDVVVLDHQMPGMSGVEVVPVLRDRGYDGPILLFTNYLTDALPRVRVPLDVWPVAKTQPDAVLELLDAYRATLAS